MHGRPENGEGSYTRGRDALPLTLVTGAGVAAVPATEGVCTRRMRPDVGGG